MCAQTVGFITDRTELQPESSLNKDKMKIAISRLLNIRCSLLHCGAPLFRQSQRTVFSIPLRKVIFNRFLTAKNKLITDRLLTSDYCF